MPGAARAGGLESGSCPAGPSSIAPPLPISAGSPNVFVNGKNVARTGDPYDGVHVAIPLPHPPHGGITRGEGSSTVFANGKPVFRIDDPTSCPSAQAEGSGNVIAGS
jgi:uncharacterized Zn-binding protein involved in type VI secretion